MDEVNFIYLKSISSLWFSCCNKLEMQCFKLQFKMKSDIVEENKQARHDYMLC